MDNTHKIWRIRHQYDKSKPVEVYRNQEVDLWNVKQDNIVVLHASQILLKNVVLNVPETGNVDHQYVSGYISSTSELREIYEELNLGDDDFLDYFPVVYDQDQEIYVNRDTREPIDSCDFLDCDINDALFRMIAIFKRPMKEEWL